MQGVLQGDSTFLRREESSKEAFPQPRPSPEGRMQTESRRSRRLSVGFGIAGRAMVVYSAGAERKGGGWMIRLLSCPYIGLVSA